MIENSFQVKQVIFVAFFPHKEIDHYYSITTHYYYFYSLHEGCEEAGANPS